MGAHRKLDRRPDDLCAGVLCKRASTPTVKENLQIATAGQAGEYQTLWDTITLEIT